jgi:DNA-binding transcriptional LysR family regulator
VNDSATKLAACMAGHGVAQILESELAAVADHGLTQLFSSWSGERFPLYLVYPSRHLPPAKVRALADFVLAAARR